MPARGAAMVALEGATELSSDGARKRQTVMGRAGVGNQPDQQ
jgi:hypothetical protein